MTHVDPAIIVDDLHITYKVNLERKNSLKNALVKGMKGEKVNYREVRALRGVTFDVPKGQCTGVIGANGAGKSTLMRAVAGILPPTKGRIEIDGKVSTLLALGVGFNTALTGRENVVLGGLAAGLTRAEVKAKFDEIAAFADLGDFIDMPMRTYSSGMFSRLAFSVSVHMEPDILIIDEALSAGDAKFKERAGQKMSELMGTAGTMLLVSHALGTIQELSDEVIWLHKGRLIKRGEPKEICDAYLEFLKVGDDSIVMEDF
ncbi:ABC transporter ATP-binding protein [Tessaracoccus flavus]|uniref:ABC transporter ATP-binding protein n=1 Tax=Tessaracoccus flavus TaxID=1610493 RepID=A0A1Q2CIR5_9ACTN|nr:ABC transporter ATP-binding protein [Tessaracoccus flavus]